MFLAVRRVGDSVYQQNVALWFEGCVVAFLNEAAGIDGSYKLVGLTERRLLLRRQQRGRRQTDGGPIELAQRVCRARDHHVKYFSVLIDVLEVLTRPGRVIYDFWQRRRLQGTG